MHGCIASCASLLSYSRHDHLFVGTIQSSDGLVLGPQYKMGEENFGETIPRTLFNKTSLFSIASDYEPPKRLHILSRLFTICLNHSNMVALDKVQESNAQIATIYPAGLVAVFAGATAGIGETSLREFARHTSKPRIYIVGRSQEACDRLDADLKSVNPEGEYTFIRSDVSLLRNVDDVCRQIRDKESAINVLFMSQGTLNFSKREIKTLSFMCPLLIIG